MSIARRKRMRDWPSLLSKLDSYLGAIIPTSPKSLYDPVRASISNGGKRIRPILTALCAGSSDDHAWLPAAASVELLHTFTLVHDDIMDNASTRRGKPTIHIAYGMNEAILAGDALVALAAKSLATSPRAVDQLPAFSEGFQAVCEGQALDKDFEERDTISIDDYFRMIELKTARIFELAASLGAIANGGTDLEACRTFAREIGIAFQLQDDLLDLIGSESFGKTIGGDILEGKRTILYALAMECSGEISDDHRAFLDRLQARNTTERDVDVAQTLFEQMGILSETSRLAAHHSHLAEKQLQYISDSEVRESLLEFSQRLLDRKV